MAAPTLTDQQRAALDTRDISIALDAGAGCGKTFVLTERYLSHLDPEVEPTLPPIESVVAITFTEAAAREMRDRIRSKCRERLENAAPEHIEYWRRLHRSLDAARVSTIHSFCSSLARQHAVELGIDPAFQVIDAPNAQAMRSTAIDDTIRKALLSPGGEIDKQLVAAAAELKLSKLRESVRLLSLEAHEYRFADWQNRLPSELVDAWIRYYHEEVAPLLTKKFLNCAEIQELIRLMDLSEPITPGLQDRFVAIKHSLDELRESHAPHQVLRSFYLLVESRHPETNKNVWNAKDWPDKEDKKSFTATCTALRKTLDKHKHPSSESEMKRAAEVSLLVHQLALSAESLYRERKLQAGMLDQDDLLKEAHRLLTSPDFSQEQKRLRESFNVLLVDEFQDTDRLQTSIVTALAGADPSLQEIEGSKLFFVGDEKQSIYRFRGAEPEVFRMLRKRVPERGRLPLATNFRSQPGVIDFINRLFEPIFGQDYLALQAARPQLGSRPNVELMLSHISPDTSQQSKINVDQQRKFESQKVVARIQQLIDSKEPLVSEEDQARPIKPGDIAILFRSHSHMKFYEESLREAGLEYYITGGLAFYSQQEFYDVVNLLRVIDSTCDEVALLGLLRSPFFGLLDETIYWLSRRGGLAQGFSRPYLAPEIGSNQQQAVTKARDTLCELRKLKSSLGVAELLTYAIDLTSYDAALLAEYLGHRKLANLEKLIELLRQSDSSGYSLKEQINQLSDFLKNPPKEAPAATSTDQTDAIRLMTIHHSKGLEFPVVVLPDLDKKTNTETADAAYHHELGPMVKLQASTNKNTKVTTGIDFYLAVENEQKERELERLFYVACTRAADRLILSAYTESPEEPKGHFLKLLGQQFDLQTGNMLGPHLTDQPLLEVINTEDLTINSGESHLGVIHVKVSKMLDQAEQIARGVSHTVSPAEAPIQHSSADLNWFSVSRLTGKLYRTSTEAEDDSFAQETNESINPRALGTLVHAILERIDPSVGNVDQQVTRWTDSLAPLHERRHAIEAAKIARELVLGFIKSDRWKSMIQADCLRREVEFLLPWEIEASSKQATIHGYIDTLYQDQDGHWRIVDYKTNRVEASGVPELANHYAMQMYLYSLAVEKALGVSPRSVTLCFLRPGLEQELEWNDQTRQTAIDLVNKAIAEVQLDTTPSHR